MKRLLASIPLLLALFIFAPVAHAALTTNSTNYWEMDGNSTDIVGAHNGTDTSITYSTANGKINQGAGFNGSSSKITIAGPVFGTAGTINVWIKPTSTDLSTGTYVYDATASNRYLLYFNTGGKAAFYLNGTSINDGVSTVILTAGVWQMLTITWTGTSEVLYLNGASVQTASVSTTSATPTNLFFGMRNNANSFFGGDTDEFGIWSRALTSTEVTQLYNGGAGLQYPFPLPASPFNFWQFIDF